MRLGEPLALDAALISTAVEDRQGLRLCGTLSEEAYRALLTRKTKAGRARQHGLCAGAALRRRDGFYQHRARGVGHPRSAQVQHADAPVERTHTHGTRTLGTRAHGTRERARHSTVKVPLGQALSA